MPLIVKKFKSLIFILALSSVVLIGLLIITNLVFAANITSNIDEKKDLIYRYVNLFSFQLIALILLFFIFSAGVFFFYKKVTMPLYKIKDGLKGIKRDLAIEGADIKDKEVEEIADVIDEIAYSIKQNHNKLECQTAELHEKNWELQEANFELEASHNQLQAIIEQLNEAEQKYHSLVKNIPEVVCVISNAGVVSFINSVCLKVLGYEKSDIIGKNIRELLSGESGNFLIENITDELKKQNSLTLELRLYRKDGKRILTEASFTKYNVNGVYMGLQAIIRDITNKREMEEKILQSSIDNAALYDTTRKYFIKTIDALIAAVEAKDTYTEGHSQRVSQYAIKIGKKLGLENEQIEDIKVAGILHDVGKIGISDNILQKKGKLTYEEYEEIKQHPSISNKILCPVGFSDRTLKAIAFHHERFDGKGYPYGLAGNDISIEAQVIAVADAFDAMTSTRSYRSSMSVEVAIEELLANKGSQFSPEVVDALIEIISEQESAA
jgi:PAS domain S-box-containing protein